MLAEQPQEKKVPLRKAIFFSWLALAAVFLYVLWILFARWQENRGIERRANEEKIEKQREQDRGALEQLGGKSLGIQMFYASPSRVPAGGTVQLCYGVANATKVTLVPQGNAVWPSHNRCVDVKPKKDTTYTLTIEDGAGHVKTATVDVHVR
ncbi:MAG: hypothetical protein NVS9B4_07520 [Candidatus Acidiferrum sp.]